MGDKEPEIIRIIRENDYKETSITVMGKNKIPYVQALPTTSVRDCQYITVNNRKILIELKEKEDKN